MNRRHHVILGILAHCFTTAGALGVIILSEDNGRADDVVRDLTDLLPMVNKLTQPVKIEIKSVKRDGSNSTVDLLISEGKLGFKSKILIMKPGRHDQMDQVRGSEPTIVYADRLVSSEHMAIMAAQIGRSPGVNEGIQLWDEPGFYRQ
jgi:hypothetical protein